MTAFWGRRLRSGGSTSKVIDTVATRVSEETRLEQILLNMFHRGVLGRKWKLPRAIPKCNFIISSNTTIKRRTKCITKSK